MRKGKALPLSRCSSDKLSGKENRERQAHVSERERYMPKIFALISANEKKKSLGTATLKKGKIIHRLYFR